MRSTWTAAILSIGLCIGCGDDDGGSLVPDAGDQDGGVTVCTSDSDCNDGVFCNGIERCMRSGADANADGCVPGTAPRCDDALDCTADSCSHLANGCRFVPIDADGDDHAAATCVTGDGESLGDDCDDNDANRYPGNPETCTSVTETHDEDCDPRTLGPRDADGDTAIDVACCNGVVCGSDCNDADRRVNPDYPEICDGFDNNCDDTIDVDTITALWFPDSDGDGFGRPDDNPVESCAPVAHHSLFDTDLDDENAAINPAATEVCDGVDNDSDAATDENDVCTCGQQGAAPCECVSGLKDCFGGLIPRICVGGHWVTQDACRGRTPACVMGECKCVDGGTSCTMVVDRSPPFVVAASPGAVRRVPRSAVVSVLLSELPDPASVNADTFQLQFDGVSVPASLTIDGELLILTPDDQLLNGRVYSVVLNGVTDEAGNPLGESYEFQFTTAPFAYPREVIGTDVSRRFAGPLQLDTNDSGEAILSSRYDAPSGGVITPHVEVFTRSSDGQWTTRNLVPMDQMSVPGVGIGENGTNYALSPNQFDVSAYYRLPNDSLWAPQSIGSTNLGALAMGGDEMCVVTNMGGVSFHIPSISGGFDRYAVAPLMTPLALVAAGNSSRHYAALATNDGAELFHWIAPQGVPVSYLFAIGVPASQPAITINEAGRAVATWVEPRGRSGSVAAPIPTQLLAFVDDTSASLTSIVLDSGGSHDQPGVVWLSDGAVLALRTDGTRIVAQRIEANAVLGPSFTLGADVGGAVDREVRAVALGNGGAIVAWAHGPSLATSSRALLVARYRNGAFEPTEIIADSSVDGSLQAASLPGDRALIVWSPGGSSPSGAAVVLQ